MASVEKHEQLIAAQTKELEINCDAANVEDASKPVTTMAGAMGRQGTP